MIINEFGAANLFTNGTLDIDEFNHPLDWDELFNRGTNSVQLLGWSLSNERGQPGLWTFPDVTTTNGQYLVIHASGLDRKGLGGTNRLHTLPGARFTVIEPSATNAPSRFYRARLNP